MSLPSLAAGCLTFPISETDTKNFEPMNKPNKQAHATDACASRCILIFLFTPVFAWANGVSCLEDLGKIVVVGDSAQLRDFAHGQVGRRQQFTRFVQSSAFDIFRRRGVKIFLENGVQFATRKVELRANGLYGQIARQVLIYKRAYARVDGVFRRGNHRF